MIHLPLELKYRPKKLSEVIGQPVIVQAFTNAFKAKNLHHAYILAGPYGTGKTTVSRILAAMENCDKKPTLNPCGKCANCTAIFEGKSFDVKELNAASNRGVDDIRSIQKTLYQRPIQCRMKCIFIDEAHSLTEIAAEAALKMIEEPPSFVRFILATTAPHRLISTIHSRCIMWKFNKVGWTEMYEHLKNICKKEKIEYEDKSLQIAAKAAKGSVRDSLQNLQTIMNYLGKEKLTAIAAKEVLGVVEQKFYFELINAILDNNVSKCYQTVNEIVREGKESGVIVEDLYRHFNGLMTAKLSQDNLSLSGFGEEEIKRYIHQAGRLKGNLILKMMDLMSYVSRDLKLNLDPQYLLNKFFIQCLVALKEEEEKKLRRSSN